MKISFDEIVLHARTGLNPRTNFKLGQGSNKYITIKNIHNNTLVVDENTDVINDNALAMIHKRSQIKKGDILFCSIGRIGDMFILEENPNGWDINESVFAFTINTNIIRQKYFYYIFKNHNTIDYLTKNSSGSTFKSIKMNQLKKMVFELPPLEEQDQVVCTLDKAMHVLGLRKQELSALDNLIKARFVEMFGLPVSNTKGWNTEPMNNVAPTVNYSGVFDEEVWLLNLDMVEAQTGRIIDFIYVSKQEIGNSTCSFDTSNVLYSKLRPYLNKVVIPDRCGYATSELVPLQPVRDKLNREYLAYLLRSDEFVNMINEKVAGAKMPRVSMGDFRNFKVPIPPIDLQNHFSSFVAQIDKSKVVVQKSLEQTQLLFDSLMQQYFG